MNYAHFRCSLCQRPAAGSLADFRVDDQLKYYCARHWNQLKHKIWAEILTTGVDNAMKPKKSPVVSTSIAQTSLFC